jgi:hypothetical protein
MSEKVDVIIEEKPQRKRKPRKRKPKAKAARKTVGQKRANYVLDRTRRGAAINSVSLPRPGNQFKVPRNFKFKGKRGVSAWRALSHCAKQYCAAVVSPFDEKATGALIPDGFKEDTVALTDVLSFSFNPYDFSTNPYTAINNPGIIGIMFAFVPRCRKAGWNFGPTIYQGVGTAAYEKVSVETPLYPVDDKLLPLSYNETTDSPGDAYTLVVCGVDEEGKPRIIIEDPEATGVFVDVYGYFQIRYTRFTQILSNINSIRLVGAGVKLGTTAAPILSGGFCYAGSAKTKEFHDVLAAAYVGQQDLTQWIKTNLEDQYRGKGVKGMMTRLPFDPDTLDNEPKTVVTSNTSQVLTLINDPVKMSKMYTKEMIKELTDIEDIMDQYNDIKYGINQRSSDPGKILVRKKKKHCTVEYDEKKEHELPYGSLKAPPTASYQVQVQSKTSDPGAQDLTSVSAEIPVMFWQYASADANNTYTIDMYSTVHAEGTPKATCPFGSAQVEKDLMLQYIQEEILTDTSMFPISHSGNSFAKFVSHLKKVVGAVGKGAGRVEQALNMLFDK